MLGLGENFTVYLNMTIIDMYCTDFVNGIKLTLLLYNDMLSYDNFTT